MIHAIVRLFFICIVMSSCQPINYTDGLIGDWEMIVETETARPDFAVFIRYSVDGKWFSYSQLRKNGKLVQKMESSGTYKFISESVFIRTQENLEESHFLKHQRVKIYQLSDNKITVGDLMKKGNPLTVSRFEKTKVLEENGL